MSGQGPPRPVPEASGREGTRPAGPSETRILIADDHEVVRWGLRSILETQEGWKVVAEARDGEQAVAKAVETRPNVAIIDYSLPIVNGVEATRQIRAYVPSTEVLMFTMHDSDILVREALKVGARGYLLKTEAKQFLVDAVHALAQHQPFFTRRLSQQLLDSFLSNPREQLGPLTTREREVLQLIAEGRSNRQMSRMLNLSIKTIESHRAAAMRKLKITSTAGLVRYAIRNKLIEP